MIAGWIILSILCGFLASSNGRSGVGYFFLSLLLSPLIGFIAVLIAGEDKEKLENTRKQAFFTRCRPYFTTWSRKFAV